MGKKIRRKGAGWVMDGVRVYYIKGKRPSRKKRFRTKQEALAHLRRRGRKKH